MQNGFSSFAVDQGMAFTLVRRTISGSAREVCIALDITNGNELWATPVGKAKYSGGADTDGDGTDGPRSTPSVDGNRVYVLNAYVGLYCLDRNTGEVKWQRDLLVDYGGSNVSWQNAASPLIEDGLIFVNVGSASQPLVAFNSADGSEKWRGGRSEADYMTHATPVAATIHDVRQVIFLTQYGLVSVAASTGQELWRYRFSYSTSTGASPVVCDDIVYCSAAYSVGAAGVRITRSGDSFSAREIWRKSGQLMNHWGTPVYHNGYLYGIYGHGAYGSAPLKCVEAATGKEKWSKTGFGLGGVLLVAGHVLVLSDSGELVLVKASPTSYAESARFNAVAGKCWNLAAISDGRIYARSTKEAVCLDVAEEDLTPLQLSAQLNPGGGLRLSVRTTDGSAIEPSRTNNIQVYAAPQPDLDPAQWSLINASWDLTDGILWMHEFSCTNWSQRFYLIRENP